MKKQLIVFAVFAMIFAGCSQPKGELVGVYQKSWSETAPYGMTFVRKGSFVMGPNDQSATWAIQTQPKTVSVDAFWMDETEITNGEYRQFVNWVRDSVAMMKLARLDPATYILPGTEDDSVPLLNWAAAPKIPWKILLDRNAKRENEDVATILDSMFYEEDRGLDATKLVYRYIYRNYDEINKRANEFDPRVNGYRLNAKVRVDNAYTDENNRIYNETNLKPLTNRSVFFSTKIINIFPDTICWGRDFSYAYNEPYIKLYFSHPGYGMYPVVGVSWEQAQAFCNWRTFYYETVPNRPKIHDYRLPTEAEWEYAARGGRNVALYPWGGNYIRTKKGCFLANFKPLRGNYTVDGSLLTAKVASYQPNDFGLYDMAGNVSEWTSSAYHPSANTFLNDLNPSYEYNAKESDPDRMKQKVIRGGSWKDIGVYLQCGVRTYEYQYERRSYIGFRCVRSYIGE